MPRLKKREDSPPPEETTVTLTAGRSRRTIKPNRKYLNDSVVLATASKSSSRSSSPDSDASEDDYRQDDDDDEEIIPPKSAAGRKSTSSVAVAAKKTSPPMPGARPRGRPPKGVTKTEPVKNLRKEVMKKMDLSLLNMGRARVVITPINKDIKRKLDLDASLVKDKTPVRGRVPERQPEKQPEKPKQQSRPLVPVKPDKQAPVKAIDDKEQSKTSLTRKKAPESSSTKVPEPVGPKRLINPVAVQKHNVEKSILDKRQKQPDKSTALEDDDDEEEDDDDDVQIIGISRETAPVLGRKSLRKSPLIAKEISPIAKKIVKPGFVSRITPAVASKITPPMGKKTMPAPVVSKTTPPVGALGTKRKAADSSADDSGHKAQQMKGRPPKASKLSITLDSDDDESSDDEPIRRSTRSSLASDKSLATASPQSSFSKAKDSSAPTKTPGKDTLTTRATMSKSVSLPALDKTKQLAGKPVGTRPIQTPGPKILQKPMAQSTPKPSVASTLADKKSKSEVNLAHPKHPSTKDLKGKDKDKPDQATIRIVNIGDIIKNKSASTPDVRKAAMNRSSSPKDMYASSSSESSDSDYSDDSYEPPLSEKPKTNNQLVATILERKRPVNLDHLRLNRSGKRGRQSGSAKQSAAGNAAAKPSVINVMQDEEVDFEDMLQTNIVTANKVQKIVNPTVVRGRGRPPNNPTDNSSRPGLTKTVPLNKTTLNSNNNNVYKPNNNGRMGSTTSLNRSGSSSPQKGPPRILNSTMKLGDSRPFAKLVANSDNKHYSIDLTDPDNNVKLIASPGSTSASPGKNSPVKTVPRPIISSVGLRNTSNAVNKPIGGAVQRSVSAITSSGNTKMKKITCYETWYVINIPNAENKPERPSFTLSMIGLGNEAANIQLPSSEWSHKIILTKRKILPAEGEEVFNGDVEDRAISEEEKRNYEPCNIMFRRRTATPGKFNLQYDRAVIFKNDTFFINVDGKNCQLVGAPCKLDGTQDIETLLAVVDFVNLKSSCVELSAS
ncbi:nucleolar protein dao-5 [Armigeres subalbatus]|uniref:nucleolar protein dao-5 n=1 Tax=Armigeres subalbatus TaxID=124917 RepID=UPI002ED08960